MIAREYGWDMSFEALVAEIVGAFGASPDPTRERCWIAERGGEILGSVFLAKDDDQTARLRLLYVEPTARGQGLGRQLVDLCVAFARDAGYRKLVLWTHEFQVTARNIYRAAGLRLVDQKACHSFGKDVVSETWELNLASLEPVALYAAVRPTAWKARDREWTGAVRTSGRRDRDAA